jgi:hypothetical protein
MRHLRHMGSGKHLFIVALVLVAAHVAVVSLLVR